MWWVGGGVGCGGGKCEERVVTNMLCFFTADCLRAEILPKITARLREKQLVKQGLGMRLAVATLL